MPSNHSKYVSNVMHAKKSDYIVTDKLLDRINAFLIHCLKSFSFSLRFESQYENDQLNGEQVFWTFKGELDAKRLYANGQCIEGCEH